MKRFFQKSCFIIRFRFFSKMSDGIRRFYLSLLGMKIGNGTTINTLSVTWPHQVKVGKNCTLEHGIYFKYDGIWNDGPSIVICDDVFIGSSCEFNIRKGVKIGDDSLIASGCRFIDHDHGKIKEQLIRVQLGDEEEIKVGCDVWLGCNVVVLKGVEIGDGAIVAAGAVVTKSILPNEIWAGVPAHKIGERKNR